MENKRNYKSTSVSLSKLLNFKKEINYNSIKSRQLLKFLGPAFIVSVAYIDPGNFATNISGGSKFGYTLIWVILCSNLMAIFLQIMSAKLGIATEHNLPEMCSKVFSRSANWIFWIIAEIGAMATDLAEFLGGTIGLYLLFHIPMIYAGLITGLITYIICYMEKYGQKVVELIISVLVAIICIAYTLELFLAKPNWFQVGIHTIIPSLPNGEAVLIAVGMLGATVMPHVIYLHSQLVQHRSIDLSNEGKLKHLKMEKIDVTIAMNIAFIINAAMVVVSAAVFNRNGLVVDTMEQAHTSLQPLLGSLSSSAFGIALLASGLSSSAVGTMAGQTIMKGFVNLSIPINIRRIITMAPALIIIALGINPMNALILSQVALSFILPFPIIQMLIIAKRKDLMGILVNKSLVRFFGALIATIIIVLNAILLYLTFTGNV
ncbi:MULTISPECIES: Nramp family divalent metal transporter [Clostridium]|uniref:Divalent metal cation transporter MntH n=2 Tax=Clostridium TaxID=1485 RepID=A0A410DRQ3_9CLOT|nr:MULTISPECIES: Nramp family divalent metal transporter [Clostridium]EKQ57664.1 MAG: natural resistance-associated macrophage protein metal ion transporter NRAMP [Clostridium sp. Maddingley MBC34-26]OOP74377.1 divalent metal cation transporter [Clostridium beijerinckii]QAA31756.1 divalent metal cation transporter [Clostridium manihotivorum]